jgi:hypothetical protein
MKEYIKSYIKEKLIDPFKGTYLEGYTFLSPASKGKIGELVIKEILLNKKFTINNRISSGHDFILNNVKAEVKFSTHGIINHISIKKDWDVLLFCLLNTDISVDIYFFF